MKGRRAPSFGIQEPPLRSSGADRVNPMDSGDPGDQTFLNNLIGGIFLSKRILSD